MKYLLIGLVNGIVFTNAGVSFKSFIVVFISSLAIYYVSNRLEEEFNSIKNIGYANRSNIEDLELRIDELEAKLKK